MDLLRGYTRLAPVRLTAPTPYRSVPQNQTMPMSFAFAPDPDQLPRSADNDRIERGFDRFREAAARAPETERCARDVVADPHLKALLAGVFGNSGFLSQCLARDIEFVPRILVDGPDAAFQSVLCELAARDPEASLADTAVALRRAKRQVALLTALADLGGVWPLETVTATLSRFSAHALSIGCATVLREAARRERIRLPDAARPEDGSGFIILGMGKLGAHELNYSSDIDLIVLFDNQTAPVTDPGDMQQQFVRMTRDLVKLMEERTGEGYVFRTDLRLRPDPGATPVALSTLAAETYYESLGQNWERAAMIKARPVAGDIAAGEAFLDLLQPFVWRRHLDFAAIEDIQSIKRQIHAHKGGSTVAVAGHNVKLGRGGIREVEFFAQTQQLIWGSRDPSLRTPHTVPAIEALVTAGRVARHVADDMIAGYRYLRRLEHRLQMVDDQQTHSLPDTDEGLGSIAAFMGYPDRDAFEAELLGHLRTIESHYADLFEESASLGGRGTLVFTGGEDHPDTLKTLTEMGFSDPEGISAAVRAWHHGRHRATRSTRAREILTELMPALLEALSQTANPDNAFRRFDTFIAGLPAGVQLFSLFQANPSLLHLVAEIAGGAPRLAEWLQRNPLLLDGVLDSDFFDALPDAAQMQTELTARLSEARDMQDVLDIARRWANDAKFQVGVLIMRNTIGIDRADRAFSDIADTVIGALLQPITSEFTAQHGRCAGDGLAVLALGKHGGRELSATSDLDLVFLYDLPPHDGDASPASDGAKPLSAPHYYQRLGQRLINALTALTGDGRLYEVDMRLRPSGNAGPLAVSLDGFADYQRESAWTWEHLALTRARVVAGEPSFAGRIGDAIREALCAKRPADELLVAVADMRARMAAEHAAPGPWHVKHVRGGLVDCEFIAQYLQLRHAHEHPEILSTGTVQAYKNLAESGILERKAADELIAATRLLRRLQGLLRLTIECDPDPEAIPPPLRRQLALAGDAEDFEALEAQMRATAELVHGHFNRLIDEPSAGIKANQTDSKDE
jgi:glutamate-ammonia-ligase adenylyltransferase